MKIVIYSCSLSPASRSRLLAAALRASLQHDDVDVDVVDLREHVLPLCDGQAETGGRAVRDLLAQAEEADAVVLAAPIYNFGVNAAGKNLVEWIGRGWSNKPVGFMCAAGGQGSYMSVMGLANSLMLDFRCRVIPRFVYATWSDFQDDVVTPALADRIAALAGDLAATQPQTLVN